MQSLTIRQSSSHDSETLTGLAQLDSSRPLHEPVMHVRIEVRHEHRLGVMQELKARGARILEECSRPRRFIVRAEAPSPC